MQKVRDRIDKLNSKQDFKKLFYDLKDYLKSFKDGKYYNEYPEFDERAGFINVFAVRCNDILVGNDKLRNNDYVFIWQNETPTDSAHIYVFDVTADPKTQYKGMANILSQQYYGNIREHHQQDNRLAICQDNYRTWVRRPDGRGGSTDHYGFYTIHIHDNAGLYNTSLGCIILANQGSYKELFLPLLKNLRGKQKNIPVSVLQYDKFLELTNYIDEQAEAIS